MDTKSIEITECPRDAMQGLQEFIPTTLKAAYLNALLKVGFDRLDFGSFVSPKAIPQMRDTADVMELLDTTGPTELLAIIANTRGALDASRFTAISYLGYPFSISETFQQRNANKSIVSSFDDVRAVQEIAEKQGKKLLIYISMAFGNPYGDDWNASIALDWIGRLRDVGISRFALADTVGLARADDVDDMVRGVISTFPEIETGIHLHCRPDNWRSKVEAAFNAGCLRFDTAIKGFGGCPMAGDVLTGNLATENLLGFMSEQGIATGIRQEAFKSALTQASEVFMTYH